MQESEKEGNGLNKYLSPEELAKEVNEVVRGLQELKLSKAKITLATQTIEANFERLAREMETSNVPIADNLGKDSTRQDNTATPQELIRSFLAKALYGGILDSLSRKQQTPASRIKQPPASRLLKLSDFLCSPKTMKLTVSPMVADWRTEYFDALKDGRGLKARWICVRYYFAFGKALALDKLLGLLKAVSSVFSSG